MAFKLSAVLDAHSNDVRCIAAYPGGSLVSGSRDKTVKLWAFGASREGWSPQIVYEGHTNYVSCVAVMPPNDDYPEGLIYTGSIDKKIRAYVPHNVAPDHILEGHSANVSSLYISKNQTLLSGSWDTTARVWLNKKTVMTLKDHEGAVWCGVILSEIGLMITGAADGNIKVWKAGRCKSTIKAHSQAVRDLTVITRDQVASCSNDGRIAFWSIDGSTFNATLKLNFEGPDFVYSLSTIDNGALCVSSGETCGVKVFADGKLSQSLAVPAISAWCVCILDNGDIAVGCSDNRIYVFTMNEERMASQDLVAIFDAELTKLREPEAMDTDDDGLPEEVGGVKVSEMPGPQALLVPGRRNGQTKMVREGNVVTIHSWSESDAVWTKIGDYVGQPKKKDPSGRGLGGGRVTYEGVEYDHVFNIDIDEGVVLKLPYNNDQDPYKVAQDFIYKHELPQDYLDQIAGFISKNSDGPVNVEIGSNCDPLTGGNAYVSGSGGVRSSSFTSGGVAADPFTGGNAYVSGSGGVPASSFNRSTGDPFTGGNAFTTNSTSNGDHSVYYPISEFLKFSTVPKMDNLRCKLSEFNCKVPPSLQLQADQIEKLITIGSTTKPQLPEVANLMQILRWPKDYTFPAIDIVRLTILNPPACALLLSRHSEELLDILLDQLSHSDKPANQMLALRSLANLFTNDRGMQLLVSLQSTIFAQLSALFPVENKQCQIAMATVLLNFTVVFTSQVVNNEAKATCLNLCLLFLQGMTDSEARFRNMVTLGTLVESDPASLIVEARKLDAKEKVEAAKLLDTTDKVQNIAQALLSRL